VTVAEVRERVRATGLLQPTSRVVAMLSGGRDSVCLLDVAVELCGAGRVHALHVNYGLRSAAAEEESHCRELCARLGVDLIVASSGRSAEAVGNFHAWAREFRYREARELARRLDGPAGREPARGGGAGSDGVESAGERGPRASEAAVGDCSKGVAPRALARTRGGQPVAIATGHTATDQVETILYRLASSPGRRALLGMAAREGRLVRPLLGLTREQTAAYCRERGLAWREDESNDSERYARARVRHGLLPALDAVHPAARANVLRTAELLREETELLDALVDAELEGRSSIEVERLRELAPALRRLVAIRLDEDACGGLAPQAGERVEEILALAARGGRAELHVGGLVAAVVERGALRMVPIEPRAQRAPRAPAAGQ
jgi:tRNA(Ile)-lysidine synthase